MVTTITTSLKKTKLKATVELECWGYNSQDDLETLKTALQLVIKRTGIFLPEGVIKISKLEFMKTNKKEKK